MTWLASNIQSNKSQEWHKSKKGRLKSPNISKSNVNMNVQRTHLTVSDKMTWIVKNVSSSIISSLIARSSDSFIYSMEWKTDACCYKHTYLSCKWKGNLIKYDVIVNIYNYE